MVLSIEKFLFLVLARVTVLMLQCLIHFSLHYLSSGHFREVYNKGKLQTFSSESGHGCLRKVPNIRCSDFVFWKTDC